uniref:NADH dehydrogenase subunit 2 n=1 Tax=Leucosolenia complicata TaxID=433461 RepID=A0A140CUS1_9METZ|nr:NADH dehydrogenase subunit 2 [Leucosolenia complicata]
MMGEGSDEAFSTAWACTAVFWAAGASSRFSMETSWSLQAATAAAAFSATASSWCSLWLALESFSLLSFPAMALPGRSAGRGAAAHRALASFASGAFLAASAATGSSSWMLLAAMVKAGAWPCHAPAAGMFAACTWAQLGLASSFFEAPWVRLGCGAAGALAAAVFCSSSAEAARAVSGSAEAGTLFFCSGLAFVPAAWACPFSDSACGAFCAYGTVAAGSAFFLSGTPREGAGPRALRGAPGRWWVLASFAGFPPLGAHAAKIAVLASVGGARGALAFVAAPAFFGVCLAAARRAAGTGADRAARPSAGWRPDRESGRWMGWTAMPLGLC